MPRSDDPQGPDPAAVRAALDRILASRPFDTSPKLASFLRFVVEAIRLRAALARYYAGAGAGEPVVIDMPRGHYVTRFRWAHGSAPRTMWRRACRALQRLLAA